jgi:predicted secreted protein
MKILTPEFNTAHVGRGDDFAIEMTTQSPFEVIRLNMAKGDVRILGAAFERDDTPRGRPPAGGTHRWICRAQKEGEVVIAAEYRGETTREDVLRRKTFHLSVGTQQKN